jgi:hypothetical protein
MDVMHYPGRPVQQPRVPLWCVGMLHQKRSMERVLKCDGIIVEKRGTDAITAEDICEIKSFVGAARTESTTFDIVLNGKVADLDRSQLQQTLLPLIEAGVTWWIEGIVDATEEVAARRIRRGPPSREM